MITKDAEAQESDLVFTSGYESILDTLTPLPHMRMLTWHYRSRDERLIAFSNLHLYDRALTTFPGIAGEHCLEHVLVTQQPGVAGQEDSSSAEVQLVVEQILEHARTRPDQSLGVITMGIKHANRITETLRQARAANPSSRSSSMGAWKKPSSSRTWNASKATNATRSSCRSAMARLQTAASSIGSAPCSNKAANADSTSPSPAPNNT